MTDNAGMTSGGVQGMVTFRLGERDYATPLTAVREVVRLQGLADLPGMQPPLAGVVDLRGTALPVLDLRPAAGPDDRADVLVLAAEQGGSEGQGGSLVGVAVDRVSAVVNPDDLASAGGAGSGGVLPSYVEAVLRGKDGPVFLVDLDAMVAALREGASLEDGIAAAQGSA